MTEPTQYPPAYQGAAGPYHGNPGQPPAAPAGYGFPAPGFMPPPRLGKVRSTGLCILLYFVTFGIYALVWFYLVHDEMKRHSRNGLGGGLALVLSLFVGFVMPYLTSNEVGELHAGTGRSRPVSAVTGLWYFPGSFLIVGPLVWFIKTNGALNDYWRSLGAR